MRAAASLKPTTTAQEDVTKAGQRKVNLIWEYTQASVALLVILANIIVAIAQAFSPSTKDFPPVLSNALFLVIGSYFSRTNHQSIGGIGPKDNAGQEYLGR